MTALLAAGTAVYTAFLFGQAKGRDLWQSPLLAPHLVVQALCAGAALFEPAWLRCLLPAERPAGGGRGLGPPRHRGRAPRPRTSSRTIRASPPACWPSGHLLPLALLWAARATRPAVAGVLTLLGLLAWEHLYVQAPQRIPLA